MTLQGQGQWGWFCVVMWYTHQENTRQDNGTHTTQDTTHNTQDTRHEKLNVKTSRICVSWFVVVLSYHLVVLGLQVLRPFAEKWSMSAWSLIHAAMLYFSAKGRNTRMPKTTTRQDKITTQEKTGEVYYKTSRICVSCVVKLSCFGAPLWWEIVSVSVIEIYGHTNYFSAKRRTEARQHDNTTHAVTERDNNVT